MSEGDLHEYEVTVTMVRNRLGERTLRDFTMVVPARDEEGARRAVLNIAWGINEGSGYTWKTLSSGGVSVRLVGPREWTLTFPPGPEVKRLKIDGEDGFVLEIAAQATEDREQLWSMFRTDSWALVNTLPWSHVIARFGKVIDATGEA